MKRYLELDSLRGLAALSVVINHALNVLPEFGGNGEPTALSILATGPLHIFWAGHQSVVLFFVLSGFVLSLPFHKGSPEIGAFFVKRICRIYIPYWTAVFLAFGAFACFGSGGIPELSEWFAGTWRQPITQNVVAQHCMLIGSFCNGHYNPVLWSLVIEMRISLIFPLLMLCVIKLRWQTSLLLVGIGCYVLGRGGHWYASHIMANHCDYWLTLMYVYMFLAGSILAKHATEIGNRWQGLSPIKRRGILAAALVSYAYVFWLPAGIQTPASRIFGDFPTVAAVCIFIVAALNSSRLSNQLHRPSVILLGKVSYSLYLLHGIILLSLVNALYGQWPLGLILAAVVPLSVIAAIISYYLVEAPSIILGKKLAVIAVHIHAIGERWFSVIPIHTQPIRKQ